MYYSENIPAEAGYRQWFNYCLFWIIPIFPFHDS